MDIIEYAEKNKCAVTIKPVMEKGKTLAWDVCISVSGSNESGITDQITEQYLDSLLAKIGRKKAFRFGAAHTAQRMRDREKFFRGL